MSSNSSRSATVERWVVVVALAGTILIALGAFTLSFTALSSLTAVAGVSSAEAWIWPLIVDGIIVVATVSVVALRPYGRRATLYPWGLLFAGALVSVAANTAHAVVVVNTAVPKPVAAAVSAVPPIVLLCITHLTVELTRRTRNIPITPAPGLVAEATLEVSVVSAQARRADEKRSLRDSARSLRGSGWSNRMIARELGVHPSTVGRWMPRPAISATEASEADPADHEVPATPQS